jgi:hypothetical protein
VRVVAIVRRVGVFGGRWGLECGLLGGGEGVDRSERRTMFPLSALTHRLVWPRRSASVRMEWLTWMLSRRICPSCCCQIRRSTRRRLPRQRVKAGFSIRGTRVNKDALSQDLRRLSFSVYPITTTITTVADGKQNSARTSSKITVLYWQRTRKIEKPNNDTVKTPHASPRTPITSSPKCPPVSAASSPRAQPI